MASNDRRSSQDDTTRRIERRTEVALQSRLSGHGPDYWRLLQRAIPECERLKAELDELGRRVWKGN